MQSFKHTEIEIENIYFQVKALRKFQRVINAIFLIRVMFENLLIYDLKYYVKYMEDLPKIKNVSIEFEM